MMKNHQYVNEIVDRLFDLHRNQMLTTDRIAALVEEVYERGFDDGYDSCAINNGLETEDL
jgi:hypothetical protein